MALPAILSVDDDPNVSRAIVRDLRRRYGESYRIVRAQSGADALDALKEMKLRGDPVAVLLADHRCPTIRISVTGRASDVAHASSNASRTGYSFSSGGSHGLSR